MEQLVGKRYAREGIRAEEQDGDRQGIQDAVVERFHEKHEHVFVIRESFRELRIGKRFFRNAGFDNLYILFEQLFLQLQTVLLVPIAEKSAEQFPFQNFQPGFVERKFPEILEIHETRGIGFRFRLLRFRFFGSAKTHQQFGNFLFGGIQIIPHPLVRSQFLEQAVRFLEEFRALQVFVLRKELQFQFADLDQGRFPDDAELVDIRSLPHEPQRRKEFLDLENTILAQLIAIRIDKELEFGIDRGDDDLVFFYLPGQHSFLIGVFRVRLRLFLLGLDGFRGTGSPFEFVIGFPGLSRGIGFFLVGSVGTRRDADKLVSELVHEFLVRFENVGRLDFSAFFLPPVDDFEIEKPAVRVDRSRGLTDVDNGVPVFVEGFPGQ